MLVKRALIFVHRWLGVALALVFLLWFPSGIGMMYWTYPSVSDEDRLDHAPPIDGSLVTLSPADVLARLGSNASPGEVRLTTFDGRPAYRFGGFFGQQVVYADTGEEQLAVSMDMMRRAAARWTGQSIETAAATAVTEPDQWTLQERIEDLQPLWKFAWPNGEEVYVSGATGEVVQYTTRASRLGAYVSAIPHWFYFTPLRTRGGDWNDVVIWSSGIGTIAAFLGLVIGVWMYSPGQRYRHDGVPTSIPYRGQKRWHTILGLVFGLGAVTWAFSGMLSMDPFPQRTNRPRSGAAQFGSADDETMAQRIPDALREAVRLDVFASKTPAQALAVLPALAVKSLELASVGGEPVYLATLADGSTRIVPADGQPKESFGVDRIREIVTNAVGSRAVELRVLDQYDRYYLDRRRGRPLPVVLVRLDDGEETRYYIDPKTAEVAGTYRASNWMSRWAYHALHSLDFPWLYNYRPLWDVVVITFMLGGTALCVTSLVLAWRVLKTKILSVTP